MGNYDVVVIAGSDGTSAPTLKLDPAGRLLPGPDFTEATWLPLASRTADPAPLNLTVDPGFKGIYVYTRCTVPGTGQIFTTIAEVEPVTGTVTSALVTSAAIATATLNVLRIYPGLDIVANVSNTRRLPKHIQLAVQHGNANPITYSVGYVLLP